MKRKTRKTRKSAAPVETVNHPAHYNSGKIEVIDFIEDQQLGFHAGNVIKYVARCRHKGGLEDLKKARWYLERLIQHETKGTDIPVS